MTTPQPDFSTKAEQDAFRARYIETADRSYINERLQVHGLPEHLHGEWIGIDPFSQFNAKSRGFVDGAEYITPDNIMHYTPEGGVIGDVKFMVISKAKYLIMKEVDDDRARKLSGIGLKEEEYHEQARRSGVGINEAETTTTRVLRGDEVASTINSKG